MARVLIVDDEADIRMVVRSILEDEGYEVIEASSGSEALIQLRTAADPLVVLVDLRMPHINGFELLQQIDDDATLATRHSYIIFSGDTESLPVVRAIRASIVVTTLPKPYDMDALLTTVGEAAAATATHDHSDLSHPDD
ncbi:MAG: hypothetical protein OJF49_000189 [Ktedonobacterales bacterium]|jgi:CheY-like chemotaxis protein|nr:MAG: hypothetical protein OJF49_000189 [Ktedonobacterales bacterium]